MAFWTQFCSKRPTPDMMVDLHEDRSSACDSQLSDGMLHFLRLTFKVSSWHLRWPPRFLCPVVSSPKKLVGSAWTRMDVLVYTLQVWSNLGAKELMSWDLCYTSLTKERWICKNCRVVIYHQTAESSGCKNVSDRAVSTQFITATQLYG